MKLKKGKSYVAHLVNTWFVIHQTGQRSWAAMAFSHVVQSETGQKFCLITGNSESLPAKIQEISERHDRTDWEIRPFHNNADLRKQMFTILKYGRWEE